MAAVFAHPFRALLGINPKLSLTAPTFCPRGPVDVLADLGEFGELDTSPTLSEIVANMPRALVTATVRADAGGDPKAMILALQQAHNEFKSTVEANIGAKADGAEVTEKLGAINATLSTLENSLNEHALKLAAASMAAGGKPAPVDGEYSSTFSSFMRAGGRDDESKLAAEQKQGPRAAMSEGVPADGGLLTPIEWDRTISGRLKLITPMRAESTVINISKAGFTKLFTDRAVGSGWVGETASRPATATPTFTALGFGLGQIYANAAASQDLLDDAEIDLETWLVDEIATEFSRQEGIAFVAGDGTNKPHGFLNYATGGSAAARHPWGAIEVLNSGNATQINNADKIVDLIYKLPAIYTPNAKFFTNRTSLGMLRKLKDGQGNFLWQPTFVAGQPSTLAGYPVVDMPDMPNIAADALAMAFGDMRETYLVVDRIGFRVLRDPFTNKPFICFYCTKRVGGGVKNPDAMKILKVAA
ncbi:MULTISPECIES: phage major capsid protein [unclassified Sphingobium]|uniref:phage major capsid protein n=1 Tax=unclassified Sphingobium TaxID=2611147 RepID=UPI002225B0D7|nr:MULTISPECIES: phage major capsid protein [unclassified Sphingobium]MCW2395883.1 HK97 family phage major capsid protein [Sphingobium sp. B8D3B]MCW2419399.1 HK97 family phage major capsid protein [Sphingobium sp. B8D3C]